MSKVLGTIGQIAGLVAMIPSPIQPIAAAVAVTASIGAKLTARHPAPQGSPADIQIGANMPSPYAMGEFYYGGSRVAQVTYGTENDVPNAYLWAVDVISVAGPIAAITQEYADFTALSFSGTAENGYYSNNTLYRVKQLGAVNEAAALSPHWSGAPNWGAGYKLSGKAAIGWNARKPKDGKRFGGGFPQTGVRGQGVLCYDPRLDSTHPGGSGPHRWADPADTAAFAAARATWTYTRNRSLQGLRYALGSWERDEDDSDAPYRRVFGVGGAIDKVVLEDFVQFANVCDANDWTCDGVIFEGLGISKWDNLKRILSVAAAKPCFRGGKLGLRINAPRVAADTITMADLGEGEPVVSSGPPFERRKNTLIPYFISADHKWQPVPSTPVTIAAFLERDGEERVEDFKPDLVTGATQAAQLAAYSLIDAREQRYSLPLFRRFPAGMVLAIDEAVRSHLGLRDALAVVESRTIDLDTMRWSCDLAGESAGKHTLALGQSGVSPAAPGIPGPEDYDNASAGALPIAGGFAAIGDVGKVTLSWRMPTISGWGWAEIWRGSSTSFGSASLIEGDLVGALGEYQSYEDTVAAGTYRYWLLTYDAEGDLIGSVGPATATAT